MKKIHKVKFIENSPQSSPYAVVGEESPYWSENNTILDIKEWRDDTGSYWLILYCGDISYFYPYHMIRCVTWKDEL